MKPMTEIKYHTLIQVVKELKKQTYVQPAGLAWRQLQAEKNMRIRIDVHNQLKENAQNSNFRGK